MGLETFVQSPQSTTEPVRTRDVRLMFPDLPALLLQSVAAKDTCADVLGSQKVMAIVATAIDARNLAVNTGRR
jgi:hypothetical protein